MTDREQLELVKELLRALKGMLEVWEEDPAYGVHYAEKARAALTRMAECPSQSMVRNMQKKPAPPLQKRRKHD